MQTTKLFSGTFLLLVSLFPIPLCMGFINNNTMHTVYNEVAREIKLNKNARSNGYKLLEEEGIFYLQAIKVKDPVTKKLLENVKMLQYRCSQNGPVISASLTFNNGNSSRTRVSCPIIIQPKILIEDISN